MDGRLNVIFGFCYLVFTIVLGPLVLVPRAGENLEAMGELASKASSVPQDELLHGVVGYLSQLSGSHFLASAVHGHGNLEALLNIVVGLVLLRLTLPGVYKLVAGLLFVVGTLLHSGMLYLYGVFGVGWATMFTKFGAISIVAGVVLMAALSILGFQRKEVHR